MAASPSNSIVRLVAGIGVFVLIGTPLLGYLWHTANDLLAGEFRPVRVVIAIPVAVLLYAVMRSMTRAINAWDAAGEAHQQEAA